MHYLKDIYHALICWALSVEISALFWAGYILNPAKTIESLAHRALERREELEVKKRVLMALGVRIYHCELAPIRASLRVCAIRGKQASPLTRLRLAKVLRRDIEAASKAILIADAVIGMPALADFLIEQGDATRLKGDLQKHNP